MGVYRQSVITNVGRSLAARVLAENKSMIFTQVKTSEYAYLEGTNIPSLTDLRDIVQAAAPSSAQVFNNSMVQVSARFDNDKIPRKYRIETIGLYARMDGEDDDILFSVNQAETPDEMPEHSDVSPSAFIYNIQVTIQNASEISFTTNPAGTATVQDILDLEFPQFDDSGGATGISSFPDFINRIKNKMDIYQFYRDLKAGLGYVLHKGQLVNNCESTATDKPLAAAVGKTLWDKIMETVSALAAHKTSGDHDGRYYTETEMDSKLGGKSDTGHTHDDRYYTETEVDNKLSGKSDTNHSHDSRYYTESEMDTKLNGKANSSHTHDDRYYTESEMNTKLSGKSDTSHGHSGMLTTSDIVNNCTSTATNKPLAAAQGKVLMDKYNQLNSDLAWEAVTFTKSSTYISGGDGFGYRMGQICICSLAVEMKKIPAWSGVVIGRVSLQSHMYCRAVASLQTSGKTVQLSIDNGSESSGKGYDIILDTFNVEIPEGEWLRGFLIYFH